MRFKTSVRNIHTFTTYCFTVVHRQDRLGTPRFGFRPIYNHSGNGITGLGVGWMVDLRSLAKDVRVLVIDSIFEDYTIQSAAENNTINLELPIQPLYRALKSATNATSASLRLTKKEGVPVLSLTIVTNFSNAKASSSGYGGQSDPFAEDEYREESLDLRGSERETIVTQDVPIRVLTLDAVEDIHEPRVREPDVYTVLPSLAQLKAISDRFTKLATSTSTSSTSSAFGSANTPRLELSANMFGSLRLSIKTDALSISSSWTKLNNPALDPSQVEGGIDGIANHPTTKMKNAGPDAWATVRIDGKDWGRVLSVGRMGGRVIACFVDGRALILYVYLESHDGSGDEGSVLTYYISSYTI